MNDIETVTLENGLTIYFYEDKSKHSTFFQIVTLFGGITKDFKVGQQSYHLQDGIAHILEHYLVECNSYGNFLRLLGEKQMVTNAYTSSNMTRFYFEAVENIEYGIDTLLRGIYSPVFEDEKLNRLKLPIYQEIRGCMDNKFYHSNQKTLDSLFHHYSFRGNGGTLEEVKKTTLEELELCYHTFYQPKNQFIVIGGNFNKEEILLFIKNIYQELNIENQDFSILPTLESNTVKRKKCTLFFPTPEEHLEISYKLNLQSFSIAERLKLDFYLHYFFDMFFGLTSSLYQKLVQEKIITSSLSYSDNQTNDFLILSIGSYTKSPEKLEMAIQKTISEMNSFKIENFELLKNHSILKMILRKEKLLDFIFPFVRNIVDFHYPYPDKKEDLQEFNFEEFETMIRSLDFTNYTVTTIKNPPKNKDA